MFVTTFYSYKGGVGRTMALTNVAALLARAGKRVLLVDFDLEAPGISSYGPFAQASGLPGIVDYIHEFRTTAKSPDIHDYIVPCDIGSGARAWVMPAGDNKTGTYGERLGSIDWAKLYDEERGYIAFEDMKGQWRSYEGKGFDYVLIDSRTGHTDIGGICTRQLPDAVAVLFVPTRQNLDGLTPMVDGIRKQSATLEKDISLVFCPSNIPDEYDEEAILSGMLDKAAEELSYPRQGDNGRPVVEIHHWMLMELLEQPLVVLSRPKSRLASEYEKLSTAIIGLNWEDKEGALISLRAQLKSLDQQPRNGQSTTQIFADVTSIIRQHSDDAEIASVSAALFFKVGDFEQAEEQLSKAVDAGYEPSRSLILRALARSNLDKKNEALQDVLGLLVLPKVAFLEVRSATRILRRLAKNPAETALDVLEKDSTSAIAANELAVVAMTDRRHSSKVADVLEKRLARAGDLGEEEPGVFSNMLNVQHLALIGARRFDDALAEFEGLDENMSEEPAFNLLMAQWGVTGKAPKKAIQRFDELHSWIGGVDPNTYQCYALIKAVMGDKSKALSYLKEAERTVLKGTLTFSCWNYETKEPEDFIKDLKDMSKQVRSGNPLKPPIFEPI